MKLDWSLNVFGEFWQDKVKMDKKNKWNNVEVILDIIFSDKINDLERS